MIGRDAYVNVRAVRLGVGDTLVGQKRVRRGLNGRARDVASRGGIGTCVGDGVVDDEKLGLGTRCSAELAQDRHGVFIRPIVKNHAEQEDSGLLHRLRREEIVSFEAVSVTQSSRRGSGATYLQASLGRFSQPRGIAPPSTAFL